MFHTSRLFCAVLGLTVLAAWLAPEVRGQDKKANKTANGDKANAKGKNGKGHGKFEPVVRELREALVLLRQAQPIYHGHRAQAIHEIDRAIHELHHAHAGKGSKAAKGKDKTAAAKGGDKAATAKAAAVVKTKDNHKLPVGWEVSNGHLVKAGQMTQQALGVLTNIAGNGHATHIAKHLQHAVQEINTGLAYVNSHAANAKKGN
jgi:hypothetical protein